MGGSLLAGEHIWVAVLELAGEDIWVAVLELAGEDIWVAILWRFRGGA